MNILEEQDWKTPQNLRKISVFFSVNLRKWKNALQSKRKKRDQAEKYGEMTERKQSFSSAEKLVFIVKTENTEKTEKILDEK